MSQELVRTNIELEEASEAWIQTFLVEMVEDVGSHLQHHSSVQEGHRVGEHTAEGGMGR
jgi:hypothetical protein